MSFFSPKPKEDTGCPFPNDDNSKGLPLCNCLFSMEDYQQMGVVRDDRDALKDMLGGDCWAIGLVYKCMPVDARPVWVYNAYAANEQHGNTREFLTREFQELFVSMAYDAVDELIKHCQFIELYVCDKRLRFDCVHRQFVGAWKQLRDLPDDCRYTP